MRPELLAVLNDSAHARLVTVVAGTGYGKSVLLALWRADPDRTRALAVLAADALDDDPVVFWSEITASLAAAVPRQEWEQVRRLLRRQTPDLAGLVLPTLLSALAAAGPVTLAIDDLHRVANPDCHAQLSWLVTHLPAGCQVLLASRVPPGMAVARLRAAADLTELGPGQLRLSWAQAAELIGGVAGAALPASMLDRLLAVTEGWPAAIYLAARPCGRTRTRAPCWHVLAQPAGTWPTCSPRRSPALCTTATHRHWCAQASSTGSPPTFAARSPAPTC